MSWSCGSLRVSAYNYIALITFIRRTISQKVGFRRIELNGPNFVVNEESIIIYDVNRHEYHHLIF